MHPKLKPHFGDQPQNMRRLNVTLEWVTGAFPPDTTANFFWGLPGTDVPTGSKWMGTFGRVMEICKIATIHELIPGLQNANEYQLTGPGGAQLIYPQVTPGVDGTAFCNYTVEICVGFNPTATITNASAGFRADAIFSSKVLNTALVKQNTRDCIQVDTKFIETPNDLTDGAGNGVLIARPWLSVIAWIMSGTSFTEAKDSDKLLRPPWGDGFNKAPGKTTIMVWYKYRDVDYATWTDLMQNEQKMNQF